MTNITPRIAIIMGSQSDWATMQPASHLLQQFGINPTVKIISAHRTPQRLYQFAETSQQQGFHAIIAGAGGAAHLPGMLAALTPVPVLGVPVESHSLKGIDSLYSIVQMPAGIPVATFAIGVAGAKNAALFAVAMLATTHPALAEQLHQWRQEQTNAVADAPQ